MSACLLGSPFLLKYRLLALSNAHIVFSNSLCIIDLRCNIGREGKDRRAGEDRYVVSCKQSHVHRKNR